MKLGAAIGHAAIVCASEHHDGDRALRLAVLDLPIRLGDSHQRVQQSSEKADVVGYKERFQLVF